MKVPMKIWTEMMYASFIYIIRFDNKVKHCHFVRSEKTNKALIKHVVVGRPTNN